MIVRVADPAHLHVTVTNTQPNHVQALEKLQRMVFPTLDDTELFTAAKYLNHIRLFPEGQFVAIVHDGKREIVVGATTTYRTQFDFDDIQHTYLEAIDYGWLSHHDPHGDWLYGVDVSVHPNYRGLRIGRRLYDARHRLARQLNLRGEIAGALMPNYVHHTHLSVAQYALRVWQGVLHDPTLSMQIKNGFRPRGILYDHISDARSNNAATLIVRENASYRPAHQRPVARQPGE